MTEEIGIFDLTKEDIQYVASLLEWCDLADEIISLECEALEIEETVGKEDKLYKHIAKSLKIFEEEKQKRVKLADKGARYMDNFPIPY